MTVKHLFAILACSFAAHAAQADVMYSWHQTTASPNLAGDLNLELVFSDAAVGAGRLALGIDNVCRAADCIDPQTSLLSLRYWIGSERAARNLIDYRAGAAPILFHDKISLSLNFLPGGFLDGTIRANNGESDFHLQSEGSLFTLIAARSDQGCGSAFGACDGAQGLLRQVAAPKASEVPEPASWLVLVAGALAAGAARAVRGVALRRTRSV